MTLATRPGGSSDDHPDVPIRPPLLLLFALAAGFLLDALWPLALLPGDAAPLWRFALGGGLLGLGLALVGIAGLQFRRAGTNIRTCDPTLSLVTSGLYRCSRNPIYVGFLVFVAGAAVAGDTLWLALALAPLALALRYAVIAREERYLEAKFGDTYRRYKERVRRWL